MKRVHMGRGAREGCTLYMKMVYINYRVYVGGVYNVHEEVYKAMV